MKTPLFEVNMSPGSLKSLASKIPAKVGIEFEMCVDLTDYELDYDAQQEPDFSKDDKPYDIDDVIDFFYKNNSSDDLDELRESLQNEFEDWLSDNEDGDESDWLEEEYPTYKSIYDSFSINWPYVEELRPIDYVAANFAKTVGRRVKVSNMYHDAVRSPNDYIFEPDSTIEPADRHHEGIEVVSPPLTLKQMIVDMNKIVKWAYRNGFYTNESCGLHMNISVPNIKNLDYVKLALFLGDKYVLESFSREANGTCASTLDRFVKTVSDPVTAVSILTKLSRSLGATAASNVLQATEDKYQSIHFRGDYIEFRSPGNDWLSKYSDLLEPTLLRFVVALDIACDPTAYQQEYAKKLYKLLSTSSTPSVVELFVNFATKSINTDELKFKLNELRSTNLKNIPFYSSDDGNRVFLIKQNEKPVLVIVADDEQQAVSIANRVSDSNFNMNNVSEVRNPAVVNQLKTRRPLFVSDY